VHGCELSDYEAYETRQHLLLKPRETIDKKGWGKEGWIGGQGGARAGAGAGGKERERASKPA
jgi:hypothetical protein